MAGGSELVVYECSGLSIASEIPLAAPRSTLVDPAGADVTVVLGAEVDQPFRRPSADLVAELAMEDYLCYTICRVGDGYVAVGGDARHREERIAHHHLHAECRAQTRHARADAAIADDKDGAAGELAHWATIAQHPFAGAYRRVHLDRPPRHCQQQHQRVLGY